MKVDNKRRSKAIKYYVDNKEKFSEKDLEILNYLNKIRNPEVKEAMLNILKDLDA